MEKNILIVGGGVMGCGIAAVSALQGNRTLVFEQDAAARETVTERAWDRLGELTDYNLCKKAEAEAAKDLISIVDTLEEGCKDCSLVIEAIFENLEMKQDLFAKLDGLLDPSVPILSNTSGLRISDIAAKMKHPERALTAHFWLPAHLVPLVEVVIGDKSNPALAEKISEMLKAWGKAPVIVKRDLPGQLANRIFQAIIREAINIVEMGLATPEDVDTAIKMGMALRFPVWGPLEHVDAVGFDICSSVQNTVLAEISARQDASPLFKENIDKGNMGYKTGKGFYDWSKKDMEALVQRRNDFIVHALHKIREEGAV